MKQIKNFIRYFFFIILILLVVFIIYGLVLTLDWPWWAGIFLFIGGVGIIIGLIFLKKIWLQKREQKFVQQIIAEDEAYLQRFSGKERDNLKELQQRWKEAIDTLKKSHLRRFGNPLYVLPWYLIIGESGSGKTTAIKSARLSSPFAEVTSTSGISGTRNCDWWFFEQAIIIDTAGRYAIPVDEGPDKEEWQKFLSLLAKYRKKEPINGLIVTISADKLLKANLEVLAEDAKNIRRRIDELMRVLGVKFPVYLLVTKCDLVQGMTEFCNALPEETLSQAMGYINLEPKELAENVVNEAFLQIIQRLRDLRLLILNKIKEKIDPALLIFPEEFKRLEKGLKTFASIAFQENPYQETPLFRGIFFSSGRQEGTPYSHFLRTLGFSEQVTSLPGTDRGLFLHDFFAKVLPNDRRLIFPTLQALRWRQFTHNLGIISWLAIGIAIAGLMSLSFLKNLHALREISHQFKKPLILTGETINDLALLKKFRETIIQLEKRNKNWWIPRFGLTESKEIENKLKEKYCEKFQKGILQNLDKEVRRGILQISSNTSPNELADYIALLVRRINLLRAKLEGKSSKELFGLPKPPYKAMLINLQSEIPEEISESLAQSYLYYVVWQRDVESLNKEMVALQMWLKHIMAKEYISLNWLIAFANSQRHIPPVSLEDYWGGEAKIKLSVQPAFTKAGYEEIKKFIKELEAALPEPLIIAGKKESFWNYYKKIYLNSWENFIVQFSKGRKNLLTRTLWQEMAVKMTTDKNPYFTLLKDLTIQLQPIEKSDKEWVNFVYEWELIKKQSKNETLMKKGILRGIAKKGKKVMAKITKKTGKISFEKKLSAAKSFLGYKKALAQFLPATDSRVSAYKMAVKVFTEDPATSDSPIFSAKRVLNRIRRAISKGKESEEPFWYLISGPLDYLWEFIRLETACYLQEQWEEKVLAEIQGISAWQKTQQLILTKSGLIQSFLSGPASAFLKKRPQKGYTPKIALGGKIPFTSDFLNYINITNTTAKAIKKTYSVYIRAMPTDTNPEAKLRPHATILELQCADGSQRLLNLNYPIGKTFKWSPENCGDVTLKIEISNFALMKKYTGYQGFPKFLADFRSGRKIFSINDFPEKRDKLKRLRVKRIAVRYQFKGHYPVLNLLKAINMKVPKKIAKCWD